MIQSGQGGSAEPAVRIVASSYNETVVEPELAPAGDLPWSPLAAVAESAREEILAGPVSVAKGPSKYSMYKVRDCKFLNAEKNFLKKKNNHLPKQDGIIAIAIKI